MLGLPKLFDDPIGGRARDVEPIGMGLELDGLGMRVASLPPSEVEIHHVGARDVIDFHGAGPPGRFALQSDKVTPFDPGDATNGFVPAGASLRLHSFNSRPNLLIFFDRVRLMERADDLMVPAHAIRPMDWRSDPRISDLARHAIEALNPDAPRNRLFIEGVSLAICARVFRTMAGRADGLPRLDSNALRMNRAKDFADANLGASLQLADMAAAAALSPFHFVRAFKAATGETPYAFIMRRRIECAANLLRSSPTSIADIALQCGFSSQAHLTTVFKKIMGATPAAFRAFRNG